MSFRIKDLCYRLMMATKKVSFRARRVEIFGEHKELNLPIEERIALYKRLFSDNLLRPLLSKSIKEEGRTIDECIDIILKLRYFFRLGDDLLEEEMAERVKALADNVEKAVYVYEKLCYLGWANDLVKARCQTFRDYIYVLSYPLYPIGGDWCRGVDEIFRLANTKAKREEALRLIPDNDCGKCLKRYLHW